jgi:hypothetical protein
MAFDVYIKLARAQRIDIRRNLIPRSDNRLTDQALTFSQYLQ